MDKLLEFKKIINESKNIVFFGGAGVSTESGIPDFRSEDGLYSQKFEYPAETILSSDFFFSNTEYFYEFYKLKILNYIVKPNPAHFGLAKMEAEGRLSAVITQNIDGLHQMAGSKRVIELHGSALNNYCLGCRKKYDLDFIKNSVGIPRCTSCNSIIKPDVVLYGESLNSQTIIDAVQAIESCDLLIIGGTSLVVYPAAGLLNYFKGNKIILINKDATPRDNVADLVIREPIGKVFSSLF